MRMGDTMQGTRARRRWAALLSLAMLGSLVVAPGSAVAATSFMGGPDQYGTFVLNDQSPVAIHYATDSSSGLLPNSTYRVKVRLCPGPTPSGTTNRGFTWNPVPYPPATTGAWVQERDTSGGTWAKCATVTTDAHGAIAGDQGWLYTKFGDETLSGVYYLLISLSGGQSSTFNASREPTVTVVAADEQGSWVHNGVPTGAPGGTVVRVVNEASSAVLAVKKTEPQGVDDDANGVVDDEHYGVVGGAGDFRLGVPANAALRVKLGEVPWPGTVGFTSGEPDTDVALGAADMTPPTRPGMALASADDGLVTVRWGAAADDTGIAGYRVYRWTAAPTGAAWSPVHTLVATVPSGQHSLADTTVTNGTTYYYEVRAVDAATNVGPRSTTASATPNAAVPTAVVTPETPDGANGWYVTAPAIALAPSAPGRSVQYSFDATPTSWTDYSGTITVTPGDSTLSFRESHDATYSVVQRLHVPFDPTPPSATVSAPTWSVTNSATRAFTVSWSAFDTISGASTYEVDYKIGSAAWHATPWHPSTMATSAVFPGISGSTYYFRVRATDAAGNVGPYVTSVGTSVPFDQTSASYSSGWKTGSRSSDFLGSYKYTTSSGRYASFKLSRGTLDLVANTGPGLGKFAVYFRGRKIATVDTYSRTNRVRQVLKLVKFSGSGTGTVKIVNLATSHRPRIEIDGFVAR